MHHKKEQALLLPTFPFSWASASRPESRSGLSLQRGCSWCEIQFTLTVNCRIVFVMVAKAQIKKKKNEDTPAMLRI